MARQNNLSAKIYSGGRDLGLALGGMELTSHNFNKAKNGGKLTHKFSKAGGALGTLHAALSNNLSKGDINTAFRLTRDTSMGSAAGSGIGRILDAKKAKKVAARNKKLAGVLGATGALGAILGTAPILIDNKKRKEVKASEVIDALYKEACENNDNE